MKSGRWAVLCLALLTSAAFAHTRSESYSTWRINGSDVSVMVSMPGREITRLIDTGDYSRSLSTIFTEQLQRHTAVIDIDGNSCELADSQPIAAAAGFLQTQLKFSCDAAPARIRYRTLFDAAPSHVHYARIFRDGALQTESLFTASADTLAIDVAAGHEARYAFKDFFGLGVDHIMSGIDHIAFLLGLLLIAGAMRRSLLAVTGFTIGHSISLGAAVLGYVSATSALVEAFIAFTITLVAVEYFLLRLKQFRTITMLLTLCAWSVGLAAYLAGSLSAQGLIGYFGFGVFAYCYLYAAVLNNTADSRYASLILLVATLCFGLVHGFGFASFLIGTGLLGSELISPLLGFNLGVEAGQLLLIAIAVGALLLTRRWIPPVAPQILAAALCGVGVFWFVSRSFA